MNKQTLVHPVVLCERCGEKPAVVLWLDTVAACRDCWRDLLDVEKRAKEANGR